jgi:hypothetical protein
MAAWFILIVLVGFIPDSLMKLGMIRAGARAPFPLILHAHAVLMGSFMLLLLAQTIMVATGRCALHKQVGVAAFVLVPALVVVGFILAPTMYHQVWGGVRVGGGCSDVRLGRGSQSPRAPGLLDLARDLSPSRGASCVRVGQALVARRSAVDHGGVIKPRRSETR